MLSQSVNEPKSKAFAIKRQAYRVFVEDVGPARFSGFGGRDVKAKSPLEAIFMVTGVERDSPVGRAWVSGVRRPRWYGRGLIALPVLRMDLWPDGETGRVPAEALKFWFDSEGGRHVL